VTNPLTRHPAVTANAIRCPTEQFGGRPELGVGRSDSSLVYLGLATVNPTDFEEYPDRNQNQPQARPCRSSGIGCSISVMSVLVVM
jgi:hypothetical protein